MFIVAHVVAISQASFALRGPLVTMLDGLRNPFYYVDRTFLAIDLIMLGIIAFHGMNGIRIVLFDTGIGVGLRSHKVIFWILIAIACRRKWSRDLLRPSVAGRNLTTSANRSTRNERVALAIPENHCRIAHRRSWSTSLARQFRPSDQHPLRAILGVMLLGLALFHGLNGVRTVIFDFDIGAQGRKFITMLLLLLGVVSLLFGMHGLWPLIVGG